jgi:2-polyprenyl-6-methoxyphenol hydroxylase-like FAD-dependent oxidoreductase
MVDQPRKVLIAGAGIAGPVLAYWLSHIPTRTPLNITILERSDVPRITGQAIDIRGPAVAVVQRMGLEPAIREVTTPERGLQKMGASGRVLATFHASGDTSKQSFTSEFEVLRADLAHVCCEAAERRPGVTFVYGDYASSVSQPGAGGKVRVEFTNGKLPTDEYDLVVGADGAFSRMRPFVTGRPMRDDIRNLNAYTAYFTVPRGEKDSAVYARIYNATRSRSLFLRPSRAGTAVHLVQVSRTEDALVEKVTGKDVATQKKILETEFVDLPDGARFAAGMHASDDFYFQKIVQVRAPHWSAGCVALVGDAAYCPSPFTGMGTSLAIYGAYVMAGELIPALRDGGDGNVPAALESYERTLRPYVQGEQKVYMWIPRMLHPSTTLGIWLLNALWWFVGSSGITKLAGVFRPEEKQSVPDYDWAKV